VPPLRAAARAPPTTRARAQTKGRAVRPLRAAARAPPTTRARAQTKGRAVRPLRTAEPGDPGVGGIPAPEAVGRAALAGRQAERQA